MTYRLSRAARHDVRACGNGGRGREAASPLAQGSARGEVATRREMTRPALRDAVRWTLRTTTCGTARRSVTVSIPIRRRSGVESGMFADSPPLRCRVGEAQRGCCRRVSPDRKNGDKNCLEISQQWRSMLVGSCRRMPLLVAGVGGESASACRSAGALASTARCSSTGMRGRFGRVAGVLPLCVALRRCLTRKVRLPPRGCGMARLVGPSGMASASETGSPKPAGSACVAGFIPASR